MSIDTSLLDKAIIFATKAHSGIERKGKNFPYIVHPLEVVSIASTLTSDQELLAAAALHDTLEDTNTSIEDLRNEFGDRVANIVIAESDNLNENISDDWTKRKTAYLEKLSKADIDVKIVALADKLSNMRAIYNDYIKLHDKTWQIFKIKDPKVHQWRFNALADCLKDLKDSNAYKEFVYLIDFVFKK